jgi:hypothetical protein
MNLKFKYEKPLFVNLSEESAVGTTCVDVGNNAGDFYCNSGSCPPLSQCATGTRAQTCYGFGSSACNPSANSNCKGCCQNGSSVASSISKCYCYTGLTTGFMCVTGNYADGSGECSTGGRYDYCY